MKNFNAIDSANNFLKAFKENYKLYRLLENENGFEIELIETKNHEIKFSFYGNVEYIIVYFNNINDDIYTDKNSAYVDKLRTSGSSFIGFFKNRKDIEKAYIHNKIERLTDEFKYHTNIVERLKHQINDYKKLY